MPLFISCALSGTTPEHPVVSPGSGGVFERCVIEGFIDQHGTDPLNGRPLKKEHLITMRTSASESQVRRTGLMSSVTVVTDPVYSDECGMNYLAVDVKLEICSYLDIHDQLAMRMVCRSWRRNLSSVFLSKYVDMDASKLTDPLIDAILRMNHGGILSGHRDEDSLVKMLLSENLLERALYNHVQTNTKVLVIRHVEFSRSKFDIVARVIKEQRADVVQLILKDCKRQEEYATDHYWWLNPQRIALGMLRGDLGLCGRRSPSGGLVSAARCLILDNFTFRNILSGACMSQFDIAYFNMPCGYPLRDRVTAGGMFKKLPIVLRRVELDCRQPFDQVYRSFMMAVDAHCPEVNPEVREDLQQMCNVWAHCEASPRQWLELGRIIQCLNDGVPLYRGVAPVDISALRQLDPQVLNKLTTEVLHRIYCLSPPGVDYPLHNNDYHVADFVRLSELYFPG